MSSSAKVTPANPPSQGDDSSAAKTQELIRRKPLPLDKYSPGPPNKYPIPIPGNFEEMDAAFFTKMLRAQGFCNDTVEVTEVKHKVIGEEGFTSDVSLVSLVYKGEAAGLPEKVVCKLLGGDVAGAKGLAK